MQTAGAKASGLKRKSQTKSVTLQLALIQEQLSPVLEKLELVLASLSTDVHQEEEIPTSYQKIQDSDAQEENYISSDEETIPKVPKVRKTFNFKKKPIQQ